MAGSDVSRVINHCHSGLKGATSIQSPFHISARRTCSIYILIMLFFCIEHRKTYKVFTVPDQFNLPGVDFVITIEETDPEKLSIFPQCYSFSKWLPELDARTPLILYLAVFFLT